MGLIALDWMLRMVSDLPDRFSFSMASAASTPRRSISI